MKPSSRRRGTVYLKTGLLALLWSGLSAGHALAVMDAPVTQALEEIHRGQPQQAFERLAPLEPTRAGDPDFDLALGIAANGSAQFSRAIFALERVISVQPAHARARAELARAMFAVGDTANARKLLQETRELGVPEGVNHTIDEFLQAIEKVDAAGRSSLRLHAEMGIGHDSNANSGPSVSSFAVPTLGGLVFTLNPLGQKTSASYWQLGAGVSGRAVLAPRWSFVGTGSIALRRHDNQARPFDSDQLDGTAGLNYREERHEFTLALALGHSRIDGKTLRQLKGLVGEWTYRPDGLRQWNTYLQLSQLDYPAQPSRDARRTVLGTSYGQQFSGGSLAYGGVYAGQERADSGAAHFSHRLIGFRGGLQQPILAQLSWFATAGYEDRRFDGNDLFFGIPRHDRQLDLSVGLSWRFAENWRMTPQLTHTRTRSNLVINDYSRSTAHISIKREF